MAQTDQVTLTGSNAGNDAVTAYFTVGNNGNISFDPANSTQLGTAPSPTQNGFAINFTLDQNQTAQFTGGQARIFILSAGQNRQAIFNNNGVESNSGAGGGFTSPTETQVLVNVPMPPDNPANPIPPVNPIPPTNPTPPNPTPPANNAPCYCTGTRILTDRGAVAVEDLAIGDVVVTASGQHRPIRWIGTRSYIGRFANANPVILPVCVRAGALAEGIPARDLWVSPDHALFLDGLLVPAELLVNGVTITKAGRVEAVTYWHVELDSHDVLLAEGAPAESFVDDGGRAIFHNAASYRTVYPHAPAWPVAAAYCAPRVADDGRHGHALDAIRQRLALRAGLPVVPKRVFGPLRGHLDLCAVGAVGSLRVAGWARDLAPAEGPVCLGAAGVARALSAA